MPVEVRPVRGPIALHHFVDLPFRLFGEDPGWVPPLRLAVYDRLSRRHPARAHEDVALWMATRAGKPVARIGACVHRLFNDYQGQSWAWVGFFESFDDQEAADALFTTAWEWARRQGVKTCVGPASFTTNDECGLLVDGFEHPPTVLTPQNPPYYERLWLTGGWEPAMDLWGWRYDRASAALSERHKRVLARLRERSAVRIRGIRMDDFDAEVGRFFDVYNSAWAHNWGFVPMTEPEVRHLAKNLKQIVDPELALIAEDDSAEPVAVALALPDVNEAMLRVRSGRLLPIGWWRLLRGGRRASQARILALGVRPEHERRALGPLLYEELLQRLSARPNIVAAEGGWVLATNRVMNEAAEALGGRRYKTWRLYRRDF